MQGKSTCTHGNLGVSATLLIGETHELESGYDYTNTLDKRKKINRIIFSIMTNDCPSFKKKKY